MTLSPDVIGRDLGTNTLLVSRSRLEHFARSIGQSDPVLTDLEAARAAGHPDLPVPPTFLFSIDLEGDAFGYLTDLGIDLRTILHGEQSFTYHRTAHAGDELTSRSTIADVYSKKGGRLEFLEKTSRVTNQHEELVAEIRSVVVIQNPAPQEASA